MNPFHPIAIAVLAVGGIAWFVGFLGIRSYDPLSFMTRMKKDDE